MFPCGGWVSEPWGPRAWFLTTLKMAVIQLSQAAEPKDCIYSVACEV